MWRDFARDICFARIDFGHEGFPDFVAGHVGLLVGIFQPIPNREFAFLVENSCEIEFRHFIVPQITRQFFIMLFDKDKECNQVIFSGKVYQRVAGDNRITPYKPPNLSKQQQLVDCGASAPELLW